MSSWSQHIVIINKSTVVSDAEITAALPAIQAAHHYDFRPAWNTTATFEFTPGASIAGSGWPAYILDDSDQAGALGYHFVQGNTPAIRVFAKTDQDYNRSWTVTLTHELWEALADPTCDRCVDMGGGTFYALETGDPVEDDQYAYRRDNVLISDFVYPAWFDGVGTRYDHAGHCTSPREVLPGGYQSKFVNGAWQQSADKDGDPRYRVRGK